MAGGEWLGTGGRGLRLTPMPASASLPEDQRATLALVLGRGRSYDEIATLLSLTPDAVRGRARSAVDTLAGEGELSAEQRGQIADYLLGQLSGGAAEQVAARLARSESERRWARHAAEALAPFAAGPLPPVPDAPLAVEPSPPPQPPIAAGAPAEPRVSRTGGAILLGAVVLAAAVAAFFVLRGGGSGSPAPSSPAASATTSSSTTAPAGAAGSSSTAPAGSTAPTGSTTSATTAKVIRQINLSPPPLRASKAAGIAEILKEGSTHGIALVAQGMSPNTTHPANAYAVWLYNSPADARILGFVDPGVGSSGRLSAASPLPTDAGRYRMLIVTLETQAKPRAPGPIILEGALTGL